MAARQKSGKLSFLFLKGTPSSQGDVHMQGLISHSGMIHPLKDYSFKAIVIVGQLVEYLKK